MLNQKYSVEVNGMDLSFSTGSLAQRANGSVTVRSGNTIVFVSATMAREVAPNQDFFPLTVDYREIVLSADQGLIQEPSGAIRRALFLFRGICEYSHM